LFTSVYYSILEQIELYVELIVATPLITFFLPDFPVSNAASITFYALNAASGTHKVLPLFAISCNKIFVATLLNPFFLKVA
jgi:hypothetical protein